MNLLQSGITLYRENLLTADDVIGQIYRTLFSLSLSDREMIDLVDVVGETDFRITEGANEKIQLEALIAHIALLRRE